MAEQNTSQSRQQASSYPSPRQSYPSPSMQPAYAYPPPSQTNPEPYRASPTSQNMSLPSLNLPPIRSIDGQQQQQPPPPQQQQQQPPPPPPPQPAGTPLPPPVAPMSAFYPHPSSLPPPGQPMGMPAGPPHIAMRYQLPPQGADQRIMSGGRHKKEIKRRTKTGCLTCRKRRIKCDEAHPTCRNCQKSKRECLGYDPIFKQQPGPAQIQPAPSAAPPPAPISTAAAPPPVAYANVPQGYAPAASAGYAPSLGASIGPPVSTPEQSYEYPAIDPALAGADPGAMSAPPPGYAPAQAIHPDLKGALGSASPYSSAASEGPPLPKRELKELRIEDLFAIDGTPPSPVPESADPVPESVLEEIKVVFAKTYAPGMDRFLENSWYTTHGLAELMRNAGLIRTFAHYLHRMASTKSDNYEGLRRIAVFETQLVWKLLALCRSAAPSSSVNGATATTNGTSTSEEEQRLSEVQKRLDVFESLLTNRAMEKNPLLQIQYGTLQHAKYWEVEFWRLLGTFISLKDDDPIGAREIDNTLTACRGILYQLENRDVIYSMAVAKHIGSRVSDFPEAFQIQTYPPNTADQDDRSRLMIAKRFLEDESAGKGTSQVITRLASMAIRSWSAMRS